MGAILGLMRLNFRSVLGRGDAMRVGSLGPMTHALLEVGGQYRRTLSFGKGSYER